MNLTPNPTLYGAVNPRPRRQRKLLAAQGTDGEAGGAKMLLEMKQLKAGTGLLNAGHNRRYRSWE